ncbi:MAG: hypothetical protein OHK0013_03670 [Sandaracinaceae bacterium]
MTHSPKTAALEALAADLLSDAGRRRIEAHLRSCEICRQELAAVRVYREAQEQIADHVPKLDWDRMELALAREAKVQATARRRGAIVRVTAGLLAAAAVTGLVVWIGSEAAPIRVATHNPIASTETTPRPTPQVEVALASGVVSMVVGRASHAPVEGPASTTAVGARLIGGALETGPRSQAHFVLDPSDAAHPVARVALGPEGRLELGSSARTEGTLAEVQTRLSRGRATVDAFESDARVVVLAGAYRVEIRAARCTIDLVADGTGGTRVSVAAADPTIGEVRVFGPEGETILTGPNGTRNWSSEGEPALLEELALAPVEGALLQIDLPDAVRFEVAGRAIEGGPSLAMRVAPGLVSIRAFEANGRELRGEVSVGPDGVALAPDALQPYRPRIQGFLSPEEITPVVQQSQRALQRCYEQALRLRPDLGGGLLRARVTLDARGAVRRVRIEGDGAPASLETCVRQEAALWAFPPPGGPMSFELPLRFHASGP